MFSDAHGQAQIVSPSTVEQGQGFFNLEDELPVREGGWIGGGKFLVGWISGGSFPMMGFSDGQTVAGGGGYWWWWRWSGGGQMIVVAEKERVCFFMMCK